MNRPRSTVTVSVVIPTRDRVESLQRTLTALAAQSHPRSDFEVIVVANACRDDIRTILAEHEWPFALAVLTLPHASASAARNRGAAAARGRLVVFLDDDILATPDLLAAHVAAHGDASDRVVIGASRPIVAEHPDFFHIGLRNWWEDVFHAMSAPGHRYSYRDVTAGNLSMSAALLARVGGFVETLSCREDFELGARLLAARAELLFLPDALGYHYDASDVDCSFRRARAEGAADVHIGQLHPALRPTLALACVDRPRAFMRRCLRRLSFSGPVLGDAVAAVLRHILDALQALRSRRRWRVMYGVLREYWYWRGVASELRGPKTVVRFVAYAPALGDNAMEIDLSLGIEAAERRLDAERPSAIVLRYGPQPIGRVEAEPGAERLRGAHLRPMLADAFSDRLLAALALERAVNAAANTEQQVA